MLILGIETSCDETAAAVVDHQKNILSNCIASQEAIHRPFAGVVPEMAARAHAELLAHIINRALGDAGVQDPSSLDAIAVTAGPGLIGSLLVGSVMAKGMASVLSKPIIAVNHLEAHSLTARLFAEDLTFPYLLLLISGGHCEFNVVQGIGSYSLLGNTIDDSIGEAFDKVAKMLGLGYPGGPMIEKMALKGNKVYYNFPRPIIRNNDCNFSFAGLKTAVRYVIQSLPNITEEDIQNIASSFQSAVVDILMSKMRFAIGLAHNKFPDIKHVVCAGGVAANTAIKDALSDVVEQHSLRLIAPPPQFCTDNGVMVAWAGMERFGLGYVDDLSFAPRARWNLSELSSNAWL